MFNNHINEKIDKTVKGVGLFRKLQCFLPLSRQLTIYKSCIRAHLNYADVIYDQISNVTFFSTIESVQYNAALAITGVIRGLSREKLYISGVG